jgi:hypothetical protein
MALKDEAATYNPIQQKESLETQTNKTTARRIHLLSMNQKASRTLVRIQLRRR